MITLSPLKDEKYFVLGLGKSGSSSVEACLAAGIFVRAWDDKEEGRKSFSHPSLLLNPEGADFSPFTALVLAPGIPLSHPLAQKLPVTSDVDLLARVKGDAQFIGITGTNGKSTTTAMIGHIMEADRRTSMGGNLGTPALALDDDAQCYVLELSSYQLERCPHLACDVAVHLNVTPDHLDHHGTYEDYIAAKENLFAHGKGARVAIVGIDDEPSRAMASRVQGWNLKTLSIGGQADYSVADGVLTGPDGKMRMDFKRHDRLKGAHNWQNMAASWAACEGMGLPAALIEKQILSFAGLPHRQFLVRSINGVAYVNDSKATNADAAEKALLAYDGIHWIIGGLSKSGGLNGLEALMQKVKHAYLIGKAADEFAVWLDVHGVAYTRSLTLDRAVAAAHAHAHEGQTVLLSPACASWDQFGSFEERGLAFEKLVHDLPERMAA